MGGWVGGWEGVGRLAPWFPLRPLPPPPPPLHSLRSRIWCLIQKSLSSWKSELSGGGRGWWGGRDRVSVSLNALCVSVIRNLMALSEIPKLYLAGRGSHHSAPHNLLINCKKEKNPTSHQHPAQQGRIGKADGRAGEANLEVWGAMEVQGVGAAMGAGLSGKVLTGRHSSILHW